MKASSLPAIGDGGRPPYWLAGAVLYGLSWPLTEAVNLSFLAWFAFVPLFAGLERTQAVGRAVVQAVGFVLVAGLVACWWWFFGVPPAMMPLTWAGGVQEAVLQAVPLVVVYLLKQRMPFRRALFVLVFLWPLWEWIYAKLPFALGSFRVGNSQADAVWLVQYVDLFGVWAVTAWVLLFNVLLYDQLVQVRDRPAAFFWRRAIGVAALMLAFPLGYALMRYESLEERRRGTVDVALIHTDFDPGRTGVEAQQAVVERAVHLTDAAASAALHRGTPVDLFVWAEGILDLPWEVAGTRTSVYRAVDGWQTPLLTGRTTRVVRAGPPPDTTWTNGAVLVPVGDSTVRAVQDYAKQKLIPFWEGLPFYGVLKGIPAVRAYHRRHGLYEPGTEAELLVLTTRDGRTVDLAAPICHEQNDPEVWAEMATVGADVFVQLAYESWFGERGFQHLLASTTRLRSIENRRSTARCSNGGRTVVIDAFGYMHHARSEGEGAVTAGVPIYTGRTLYARFPGLFPFLCLVGVLGMVLWPHTERYTRRRSSQRAAA